MSNVVQFNFQNHDVRVFDQNGEPWWVLADVCSVLRLLNPSDVAKQVPEDDLGKTYLIDSMGREQQAFIVNEAGLYRLIFRSNKPEAETFQRWVFSEVLPTIRKTGRYSEQETRPARVDWDALACEFVSLNPHWDVIREMTLCHRTIDQIADVVPMSRSAIGRARLQMLDMGLLNKAPFYRKRAIRVFRAHRTNG